MSETRVLPRIEWRDDFRTGVDAVDHEHRQLVDILNGILDRLEAGGDADEIADYLGEVFARISAHFALEEQVMRQKKYDDYAGHKDDHESLLDDIRDLMDAYEDGSYADRVEDFAAHLRDWFTNHFATRDARLHGRLGE